MTERSKIRIEKYKVAGERLLGRVRELVHEGNVRRITLKDEQDRTLLEIPLTLGVIGAVLLPVWVALGAIAALAANYTLEVEKTGEKDVALPRPAEEKELTPVGSSGGDALC